MREYDGMSYDEYLEFLTMLFLFEPFDDKIMNEFLTPTFKRKFPGNYDIAWDMDASNVLDPKLTFHSSSDEMMFYLKYR
jgi:hypothetical protein